MHAPPRVRLTPLVKRMLRPSRALRLARAGERPASGLAAKYGAKLEQRAKAEGMTVPELLQKARAACGAHPGESNASRVGPARPAVTATNERPSTAASSAAASKLPRAGGGEQATLDQYVDVEKLSRHSAAEIEMLWKARFLNREREFCGVIDAVAFARLYVNARRCPLFVLPLAHADNGVELHYVQWHIVNSNTVYCLLTTLAQYKLKGEFSEPHTTLMLHADFLMEKQIVLENARFEDNKITQSQSSLLVLLLQRFYTAAPGSTKAELLQRFNRGDPQFSVDEVLTAADTLD